MTRSARLAALRRRLAALAGPMLARSGPAHAPQSPTGGRPETPLLRRTRWRLIAWSGGTTLVVLLVLGAAIYFAAASSLESAGIAQLRARVAELNFTVFTGPAPGLFGGGQQQTISVTSDPAQPGVLLGGQSSGTIAVVVPLEINGREVSRAASLVINGQPLPGEEMAAIVRSGQTAIRDASIGTTPVRILASPIVKPEGIFAAVVIGDRTSEVDTLRTLLTVLLAGGLAVLAASIAVGYLYAGRALVPIRESLRRQREFTADASHELRTPLAITRAAIAELRRGRASPVEVDRAIDDLEAGTTRLEQLVADLLLLARTDAEAIEITPVATDLAQAAAEASEAFEPVAGAAGVSLALDLVPAPLEADEARLRQLVGILLDNAVRHSPAGGRVTIVVRPGAVLSVEDEGPGIASEHLDRVFDRFWRAPGAPVGGTGLGLAIAHWIVERHRGTISAQNREGRRGARFVVRLPGG